ncbi:MAG: AAA family ATPase [Clostridia bacterium]
MIRHLKIRDFAIIENADIDFHDGLNIITGETGSENR